MHNIFLRLETVFCPRRRLFQLVAPVGTRATDRFWDANLPIRCRQNRRKSPVFTHKLTESRALNSVPQPSVTPDPRLFLPCLPAAPPPSWTREVRPSAPDQAFPAGLRSRFRLPFKATHGMPWRADFAPVEARSAQSADPLQPPRTFTSRTAPASAASDLLPAARAHIRAHPYGQDRANHRRFDNKPPPSRR